MSRERILSMLEAILSEVDYDLSKSIFDDGEGEDPEMSEETRDRLVEIVERHLPRGSA